MRGAKSGPQDPPESGGSYAAGFLLLLFWTLVYPRMYLRVQYKPLTREEWLRFAVSPGCTYPRFLVLRWLAARLGFQTLPLCDPGQPAYPLCPALVSSSMKWIVTPTLPMTQMHQKRNNRAPDTQKSFLGFPQRLV